MRKRSINIKQQGTQYLKFAFGILTCCLLVQGCVPTVPRQSSQFGQQLNPYHQGLSPYSTSRQQGTYYAGYSKKYVPFRDKLAAGDCVSVLNMMEAEERKIKETSNDDDALVSKLRLVGVMERASLSLQLGEPDKALNYCRLGQQLIEERASESYVMEGASTIGSVFADIVGASEFGRYEAPGYEKVMILDLASMAYLLKGDDRAFNVARLAVEWQDEEKEKFAAELEKVKEKEEGSAKDSNAKQNPYLGQFTSAIDKEFSKYESSALSVPNAFVNPFGDYVTGMVNEFKSVKLKSLISNASIAYKQALELNPQSEVLQQAVKDTEARKPAENLIHIVALDGFVPEKKVMSIPIKSDFDVEIPTYNPIVSKVKKIKVFTSGGKTLATLSPVANVEALALRHQKDSLPYIQSMVLASVVRDIAVVTAGNQLFSGLGGLVRSAIDTSQEPDTTSWMTLPSTVLAARIYAPKGLETLKIRSYDDQNRVIAEKNIKLNEGKQHFVLVRSIEKTLYAYSSKKIWSQKG